MRGSVACLMKPTCYDRLAGVRFVGEARERLLHDAAAMWPFE
jgi:hypothetical protein